MAILDHRGNPIERQALSEPQTSQLGHLHREWQNHPSRGITPGKMATIMTEAEQGNIIRQHELFLDMEEKDAHIFAEMGKRRRALLTLPWSIQPPRNPSKEEERRADEVGEMMQDIDDFEDVLLDMGDAIGHAFSNLVIHWNDDVNYRLPERLEHCPPTWFKLNQDNQNELRLRDNTATGAELWAFGWIRHTHRAKPGYIARGGLHRVLAWPFLFKNYSVRDLAELLEIYGLPVRIGQYPPNASDAEKSTLLKAVTGIGHNAAGIIPEGMAVEFKDASTGRADPFMVMMTWCERSQSKAILGQTLSAEAASTGLGSGVADLQGDVKRDLMVSDAKQMSGTLSRDLVYPIAVLNNLAPDGPKRAPRFVFETAEPEDLQARAERDKTIVDIGYRPTPEYIERVYGEGFEPIPTRTGNGSDDPGADPSHPSTAAGDNPAAARLAALRSRLEANPEESDENLEAMIDRLEAESNDAVTALINQVRRLVDETGARQDLDDQAKLAALRDGVLRLYPDLSPDDLAGTMRLAFAAAELYGRYEVTNEEEVTDDQ